MNDQTDEKREKERKKALETLADLGAGHMTIFLTPRVPHPGKSRFRVSVFFIPPELTQIQVSNQNENAVKALPVQGETGLRRGVPAYLLIRRHVSGLGHCGGMRR